MTFSTGSFLLATMFITTGALLQASTGLGAGLVIVPLLALISLDLVPGPVILGSIALSGTMAWIGRRHIRFDGLPVVTAGLVAGSVAGALGIAGIPIDRAGLLFGILILAAVAISFAGLRIRYQPAPMLLAGVLSGFMGTTAAIGAPVLALLYQHEQGGALRATLAFLYLISALMMLCLLHLVGRFGLDEMFLGLFLMPGYLLGYFLAPRMAALLDRGYSRLAILLISSVSATLLILRSLT